MNLERVEIFISANFLIHAFHYLVYILQCPVFLSSLFLSQVIVILFHYDKFKSCNRKRLRRDEPIFLKTQFSVYGKKKKNHTICSPRQNCLAKHHHICCYLRISKVLLVLVDKGALLLQSQFEKTTSDKHLSDKCLTFI